MTPLVSHPSMRIGRHSWRRRSTISSGYRQKLHSPIASLVEEDEYVFVNPEPTPAPVANHDQNVPRQPRGFDGYLSDGDGSHTQGQETPNRDAQATTDAHRRGARRYLTRNVMSTPEAPEPSALPQPALDHRPSTKPNIPSLGALGRRLSMSIGRPSFSRTHDRGEALLDADPAPSRLRSRMSWIGSIRRKIRGPGRRDSLLDNMAGVEEDGEEDATVAETCADVVAGDKRGEGASPEKGAATPPYPRLRSQPSLCRSSRTANADDVAFVPDTDNLAGKKVRAATPVSLHQAKRRSQFLLPDSTGSSTCSPRVSSYNALKAREYTNV
ncbi:hypothetical protein LPJ53_001244 [Coemansia erecta]|uniref:Uncharacterized protein n=1 Tax=Coemansia erecta TaxID=147472 RepID=A0A9W7Y5S9_9FUNG|nr:hypothetical protein LPJ53_001244 [Coemansia erecta]